MAGLHLTWSRNVHSWVLPHLMIPRCLSMTQTAYYSFLMQIKQLLLVNFVIKLQEWKGLTDGKFEIVIRIFSYGSFYFSDKNDANKKLKDFWNGQTSEFLSILEWLNSTTMYHLAYITINYQECHLSQALNLKCHVLK